MIIEQAELLYRMRMNPKAYPIMLLNRKLSYGRYRHLRSKGHIIKFGTGKNVRYGIVVDHYKVKMKSDEKITSKFGHTEIFENEVSLTVMGPVIYFKPNYPKDLIDEMSEIFDVQHVTYKSRYAVLVAYLQPLQNINLEEKTLLTIGKIE